MKLRTIEEAYKELKTIDPGTAISKNLFRAMVTDNKIHSIKAGNKYLVDVDRLEEDIRRCFNQHPGNRFDGIIEI